MKNYYSKIKNFTLIILISFSFQGLLSQANEPFNCVTEAYLFQTNDVYAQNLASGNAVLEGIDLALDNINAVGYNEKDGYIWGSLRFPDNTIIRIGKDYSTTTFEIPGASFSYVGDVNKDGIYYLRKSSNSYYTIDLDPSSATYLTVLGTQTISKSLNVHDWAFNAVDGKLYTVEKNSNNLYRIDTATNVVETLGEVPILSGLNYTYGAVYFDVDGNFYVSANQTGTVYIIRTVQNVTSSLDMNSNLFAFGPSSNSNDGARCPTAPVPQEDCTNGVDDDGDGLVDCDDPSCSGVASCPTITPTSTGNSGGLESNNRLSTQINRRNINRIKTNYTFDVAKARKVEKNSFYARRSSNQNISLWDLVPMDVIPGTTAVESSPSDLVDITNATDLVSVDYIRDNKGYGTLLLLKTENKVYEHTKHICDRFTGAELLSVSNMEINDALFIKSRVKQPDGSIEFVATFSVRESDDNSSFIVESHWNLDQYEEKGYYNFQVWASSIDDLYNVSQEVLNLLEVQKPISEYKSSDAPLVFIKKAAYRRGGKIDLEIINNLRPSTIIIEGNKRATETATSEPVTFNVDLTGYINNVTLDIGNLYDFGFRLRNQYNLTPDDLFLSDGTWGVDDSSQRFVDTFNVIANNETDEEGVYKVERNISLVATANQDVSVYRSLTPKFEPVDLTAYDQISFDAKGVGTMKMIFVKESISDWNNQPYITVNLTDNTKDYVIYKGDITSNANGEVNLNDVKMLFITLVADDGSMVQKNLDVGNIKFAKQATASIGNEVSLERALVSPNPVETSATFTFNSKSTNDYNFEVFNVLGKQVHSEKITSKVGSNTINFDRKQLSSGIYFYKISSKSLEMKGKLIFK
ncbi:T9SS type A sorting domain-containing protein [Tenacibaculum jejuense]|uniref:Uncharacterized protein n=1 Tax=Tenacibaculum jejuense TaxID=584609 RepID=A0A238UBC8_9FLAO|nr:T9SS type A sorting domain-containing protein [Tenacibaculum jejuense]SNR16392.1 Protein of unknown function precursor containing a C-terminal secretion signal [Tenacibaculum jejuense]